MNKCVCFFLFCVVVSCGISLVSALEVNVVGQSEIIHKSPVDAFVRITIADDESVVLSQYWPGKDDAGVGYVYDIFYTYTPASGSVAKLDIPVASGHNGFVTDGVHFIAMWGDYWPQDLTFTLYDFHTGEERRIYPGGYPNPDWPMYISGDYFVYSDSGMLVPNANVRYLRVYNISSGETIALEKPNGYMQNLKGLLGDSVVYMLYDIAKRAYPEPWEYWIVNLTTGENQRFLLPDGVYPENVYPPYAVRADYDEMSSTTTVKLAEINLPPIVRPTTIPPTMEGPLSPRTTQAGSPAGMTVGLIAFVLACVFAVLWRKK